MELSLPFILAFIGSAVALIIGMVIYGDISEAIECPASGGGEGAGSDLFNTIGLEDNSVDITRSFGGGVNITRTGFFGQLVTLSNKQIDSVRLENFFWDEAQGSITAKIFTGVIVGQPGYTIVATSDPHTHFPSGNFNNTFVFNSFPTLSGSDIVIGFEFDRDFPLIPPAQSGNQLEVNVVTFDVGGNEGTLVVKRLTNSTGGSVPLGWDLATDHASISNTNDLSMKVTLHGGSGSEVGSEQCQQAKDISWTVIGIIPVALFFSLFAIFSALGTGRQS